MATATTLNLPPDLKEALDQAVAAIVEIAHPQLIILFGSWAEGTARADSDVDLLVVAETDERVRLGMALRRALRPLLGDRDFDLVITEQSDWPWARGIWGMIPAEADQHGVRLYERAA
jgi:predicted nucleotidyltransferase